MKKIEGFSGYIYFEGQVYKKIAKTNHSNDYCFKMKNDDGSFKSVSLSKVKALAGDGLQLPEDAMQIRGSEDYIDPRGNVYNFGKNNPHGIKKTISIGHNGYPRVQIKINGKMTHKEIHILLADTFIHPGYVEQDLCCMHFDDNKMNYSLDNLSVGTYSKNNKDAYERGLNPGNKGWKKAS